MVNYSCVQGGWSGGGIGNIDDDPIFVNVFSGDLRLDFSGSTLPRRSRRATPAAFGAALAGRAAQVVLAAGTPQTSQFLPSRVEQRA